MPSGAESKVYTKTIEYRLFFRLLSTPDSSEIEHSGHLAQTIDQSPHEGGHEHA